MNGYAAVFHTRFDYLENESEMPDEKTEAKSSVLLSFCPAPTFSPLSATALFLSRIFFLISATASLALGVKT